MTPAEQLRALAESKGDAEIDRALFSNVMAQFRAQGWTEHELAEYRSVVGDLMRTGSDDEKQAAREFWAERGWNSALGINARIRESNATGKERIAA